VSGVEFVERVRARASKTSQNVVWATRKKADSDGDGASLLRGGAALSGYRSAMLPAAALEVERLKDANAHDTSDSVVQSVRFHPNSQLLLTASLDKRLKIFQIDGKNNSKVQGVHFEDLPIQHAEFSGDGEEVLVSGRRKFFYIYNLASATISKVQGVLGSTDKFLGAMIPSPDR
jgi:U3 small nucleolar RNA-associated protein 18